MNMKSLKGQFIAAIAMVLVAAIALGGSTYAWFSVNRTVTATGMQVQAKAEEGLVISNAADGTYNLSASSAKSTVANLVPGSTSDLTNWFHSNSSNPAQANTQAAYETAAAWVNNTTVAGYVVHDFYIRSSAPSALSVKSLDVNKVEAKVGEDAAAAQDLSKALRVGVRIGSDFYIYAPIAGYTTSYTVTNQTGAYDAGDGKRTTVTPLAGTTVSKDANVTSIPASSANGTHVEVFVWFEGEDANCISNNIAATLEQLTVTVEFSYTDPAPAGG